MGLIRKQAGFDLKAKIEEWIEESPLNKYFNKKSPLDEYFNKKYKTSEYWIDLRDDLKLKVGKWIGGMVLENLLLLEVPEYIMFEFDDDPIELYSVPSRERGELIRLFNNKKSNFTANKIAVASTPPAIGVTLFDIYSFMNGDWVFERGDCYSSCK